MHFWLAFCYFCCLFSARIAVFGAGADGVAGAVFRDTPVSPQKHVTFSTIRKYYTDVWQYNIYTLYGRSAV